MLFISGTIVSLTRTQINLSLHKKRYHIYTSLIKFISDVLKIPLPKKEESTNDFTAQFIDCKTEFWTETRERVFLIDMARQRLQKLK